MSDMRIKMDISRKVQDVQDAIMFKEDITDKNYIQAVNEAITEVESTISALKFELSKHNLNDWE